MSLTASGLDQLAGARVMLAETKGFLYLPVFVPHQVAGEDVLQDLRAANAASGYDWREVGWPKVRASTDSSASAPSSATEIAEARKALLSTLDENMEGSDSQRRTLVLDASPSSRHLLAQDVVVYLNQRRQSLRERAHRLIVIWPLALRDDLIGGAPDLWSVRALAPCLAFSDSALPDRTDERPSATPREQEPVEIHFDTAAQERKFALWKATGDLHAADISTSEVFSLISTLLRHHQGREVLSLVRVALQEIQPTSTEASLVGFAAIAHAGLGEHREALSAAREALALHRRLAQANPARYEENLATSVQNVSIRLSETGDRDGALEAAREAVAIRRRLSQENPARYEPDLATTIHNLAIRLSETGDRDGALEAARESGAIYRRLAQANRAEYESNLAASVNNLASFLSETGDRDGALEAARESVAIRRRLARANPAAFEPDLAMSVSNLAKVLSETGDRQGAAEAARESVAIFRRLAQANPAAYEPNLARSLCALAMALGAGGQTAAAREAAAEAVKRLTPPAAKWPEAFGELLGFAKKLLAEIDAA